MPASMDRRYLGDIDSSNSRVGTHLTPGRLAMVIVTGPAVELFFLPATFQDTWLDCIIT